LTVGGADDKFAALKWFGHWTSLSEFAMNQETLEFTATWMKIRGLTNNDIQYFQSEADEMREKWLVPM